jgi:head-tail adaptor
MARAYKPNTPFNVPMKLLIPTTTTKKGVTVKTFTEGITFFCSFRSFNGTEITENDVLSVVDTVTIDTWYHPDIKANCRIRDLETNEEYAIMGTPDNINRRNQFLQFRVQKVGGKA